MCSVFLSSVCFDVTKKKQVKKKQIKKKQVKKKQIKKATGPGCGIAAAQAGQGGDDIFFHQRILLFQDRSVIL